MQQGLVIDDHPIVREGLKDLLQKAVPALSITTSPGTEGVLEEVCGRHWAFIVLDLNLPRFHGLDIVKQAKSHCPKTPILVFSLYAEEQYADRALRAGAVAYISKDRPPSAWSNPSRPRFAGGRCNGLSSDTQCSPSAKLRCCVCLPEARKGATSLERWRSMKKR